MPVFLDQVARSQLQKEMRTLDDIDIALWQMSDESRGVHIPGMDTAGGQRGADATSGSTKGKEQVPVTRSTVRVGSQSPPRDAAGSSASTAPPERKRRLFCSDGSIVGGLPQTGQRAPKMATAPQPDKKVTTTTMSSGIDDGGSTTTVKEAAVVVAAMAKKALEAVAAKEAATVKTAEEVTAAAVAM
jgi:hypothetical protein